jgi:hypothetical protein
MKNLIKFLFIALLSVITYTNSFSQAGNTGPGVWDYELRWLCDSASSTTFYRVSLHRPGYAPVSAGDYKPDGTSYTPTSTIKYGPCSGTTSFPDSTYTFMAVEMCDTSATPDVSFIKIFRRSAANVGGAGSTTILGTYKVTDGTSYSAPASSISGFCNNWQTSTPNIKIVEVTGTTGTITAAEAFHSVYVTNIGNVKGFITVNSQNLDLYPGETWFCQSQKDFENRMMDGCGSVSYNTIASGSTTFHITARAR